ncbi:MAG: M20/M25/M40 family metallo-hydrolase [Deinococcota bacterium]
MSIQLSAEALLTRDLISCHTPSGRERAAADCLVQAFQTLNYDEAYIDAAGNAVGILHCEDSRGNSPEAGPTVMLNGHIDTVALGDETLWAHPPLSGAVSDEEDGTRMWGRGACDMKAAVACMVYAAKDAAEAGFNGTLIVTGVVQEEVGGFGARYLATEQQADVVILGEPSKLKLMVGHRGRLEVHAHIQGKIAHAANNSLGLNALYEAAEVLNTLETLELPTGGRLNGSSLTPTNLASSPDSHNVVPGEARLVIDYRNIPEDAPEAVLARLQEAMPKAQLEVLTEHATSEDGQVAIDYPHIAPAYLTPLDSPYLATARQTLQNVLPNYGVTFEEDVWWFCTDAPYLADMSNGKGGHAVIIGFGPGEEERAHTTHENVPLKHLEVARASYRDLCLAYAREYSSQAVSV